MSLEQNNIQLQLNRITRLLEAKLLPEFLTVSESAELLRCSKSKIRTLLRDAQLPFTRIGSSIKCNILIKYSDLKKVVK